MRLERLQDKRIQHFRTYFNSIKVRLERDTRRYGASVFVNFNSIKVRLELSDATLNRMVARFQFHKGAIRTAAHIWAVPAYPDFNSIKVRLEPTIGGKEIISPAGFQFHKGAIRTAIPLSTRSTWNNFNSIKVRLELLLWLVVSITSSDFNSIKVRLELCCWSAFLIWCLFQFHKGAIRTR